MDPALRRVRESGAVLMEVVLALVLFVGAATVIGGGLSAAIRALERVRLNNHAVDLAVSMMSELQMGIRPVAAAGPEAFEAPFEDWTWETIVNEPELEDASRVVEVAVRHEAEGYVLRLVQLLPVAEEEDPGEEEGGDEVEEEPAQGSDAADEFPDFF